MSDMTAVITPKSDQKNADDLLSGPITIKITEVKIRPGTEQPISIHFEGDEGKPYKACKSMCRVMVAAWGPDSHAYVGRSMTLYRDPLVKWAGMEVGGIRISHMSDIGSPMTMALTATKGSRKPFTVKPLAPSKNWPQELNNAETVEALGAIWKQIPASDKPKYLLIKDQRKEKLSAPVDAIPVEQAADFAAEYAKAEEKI